MGDLLPLALGALRAHRLRSFLSMLGIAIGVAAVILLTSIGAPDATKRLAHMGLSACLTKPARSAQLYDTITAAMARAADNG